MKNDFGTAAYWYARALDAPDVSREGGFSNESYRTFVPLLELSVCCYNLKDLTRAKEYHERAKALSRPTPPCFTTINFSAGILARTQKICYDVLMNTLPQEPEILLGFINMKLRDSYSSLEELCDDLDLSRGDIDNALNAAGYYYDEKNNRYK